MTSLWRIHWSEIIFFFSFWDRILLCNPGCPRTLSVVQACLKLREPLPITPDTTIRLWMYGCSDLLVNLQPAHSRLSEWSSGCQQASRREPSSGRLLFWQTLGVKDPVSLPLLALDLSHLCVLPKCTCTLQIPVSSSSCMVSLMFALGQSELY